MQYLENRSSQQKMFEKISLPLIQISIFLTFNIFSEDAILENLHRKMITVLLHEHIVSTTLQMFLAVHFSRILRAINKYESWRTVSRL